MNEKGEDKTIRIWRPECAPKEYQLHSDDVDWIAFIPDYYKMDFIPWLEFGSSFGCCDVLEYPVEGGEVRIGTHS